MVDEFVVTIKGLDQSTIDKKLPVVDSAGNEIGIVEVSKNDDNIYVYAFEIERNGQRIPVTENSKSLSSVAKMEHDTEKRVGQQPIIVTGFTD